MTNLSSCTHPHVTPNSYEFLSSPEHKKKCLKMPKTATKIDLCAIFQVVWSHMTWQHLIFRNLSSKVHERSGDVIQKHIVLYNESDSTYIYLSQSLEETWIIEYVVLAVFIIQRFWGGKTFVSLLLKNCIYLIKKYSKTVKWDILLQFKKAIFNFNIF